MSPCVSRWQGGSVVTPRPVPRRPARQGRSRLRRRKSRRVRRPTPQIRGCRAKLGQSQKTPQAKGRRRRVNFALLDYGVRGRDKEGGSFTPSRRPLSSSRRTARGATAAQHRPNARSLPSRPCSSRPTRFPALLAPAPAPPAARRARRAARSSPSTPNSTRLPGGLLGPPELTGSRRRLLVLVRASRRLRRGGLPSRQPRRLSRSASRAPERLQRSLAAGRLRRVVYAAELLRVGLDDDTNTNLPAHAARARFRRGATRTCRRRAARRDPDYLLYAFATNGRRASCSTNRALLATIGVDFVPGTASAIAPAGLPRSAQVAKLLLRAAAPVCSATTAPAIGPFLSAHFALPPSTAAPTLLRYDTADAGAATLGSYYAVLALLATTAPAPTARPCGAHLRRSPRFPRGSRSCAPRSSATSSPLFDTDLVDHAALRGPLPAPTAPTSTLSLRSSDRLAASSTTSRLPIKDATSLRAGANPTPPAHQAPRNPPIAPHRRNARRRPRAADVLAVRPESMA